MYNINRKFLDILEQKYKIERVHNLPTNFSVYYLCKHKKNKYGKYGKYLFLPNDRNTVYDINDVLDCVSILDKDEKLGYDCLGIMSLEKATKDMCFYFNGKSFVHFIFIDEYENRLIYDKNFYYYCAKEIKEIMDIYQNCYECIKEN